MQISTAIKWGHRALTSILLIVVIAWSLLEYSASGPYDDRLYSKQQLSPDIWLYVTKYQGGGATVSFVYRYYLNKRLDDPMPTLKKSSPFLTADTDNLKASAVGNRVMVKLTGKVFDFTNSVLFYDEKIPIMPTIDFDATGVNAWK